MPDELTSDLAFTVDADLVQVIPATPDPDEEDADAGDGRRA